MRLLTLLGAVTVIAGGCTASDPGVALEESAKPQFASLCGTIGITLGARDLQRYRIRGGEVARVDRLPDAPEQAWGGDPFGARQLIHTDRTSSGQWVARSSLTRDDIGGSGDVVWFDGCAS